MLTQKLIMVYFLILNLSSVANAEICAHNFNQLTQTEKLKAWQAILPKTGRKGFVNQSRGSFLYIESSDYLLEMTFLTTVFFDLYPVKRSGKIRFCDTGSEIQIVGLGYVKSLKIVGQGFQFGDGGPAESFSPGEIPEVLRKTHKIPSRAAKK